MLPATGGSSDAAAFVAQASHPINYKAACDHVVFRGWERCFALVRTDVGGAPGGYHGNVKKHATPSGYGPSQLQKAYGLTTSGGSGQTVAVIESGDYPTAAADLTTYRSEYGLSSCTTSNGCFEKVSQTGSTTSLPKEDAGWAEETALDMDMVSAICPNCHILIVEATSATTANLEAATNEAAKLGATEISNSYGGSEYAASDSAYSHSGIVITASAGDDGYAEGSQQPCSFATVVCTGGTSLKTASNSRGYTETVWNDLSADEGASGSGCSSKVTKPSWQTDKGCTKRSQSDVSFDADPENGVAVYDSTSYEGYSGWLEFGGTSVASPALSAVFALAGNASSLGTSAAQTFWKDAGTGLNAVTSGNNLASKGKCGSAYAYICTAGTNTDGVYSGPGGWGTPSGTSDF
ncbi:MAG TPA: peptidase S8 [Verrucomicrobiae bacterium]|nr:peptidase S8 [Verrucomicrobiae bacterium]